MALKTPFKSKMKVPKAENAFLSSAFRMLQNKYLMEKMYWLDSFYPV